MIYLKACPKCQGDMSVAQDMYGHYRQCVQCGCLIDLQKESSVKAELIEAEERAA